MGVVTEEYISEWSKIPVPLQHQFFKHAQEEAERLRERILKFLKKLNRLKRELEFRKIVEGEDWRDLRIAVIDGSFPPLAERVGVRMGIFCAGYFIFEGNKLIPRDRGGASYRSGIIAKTQIGEPWKTGKIVELLCTKLEREIALYCLEEKGVDYVLIDGPFFGFQARCQLIREDKIDLPGYTYGSDLVDKVRDLSIELMRTRRAIAVIKRVRTMVFDGYILYKTGKEEECFDENDRAILTWIMPEKSYFAYRWLFGDTGVYQYYSNLRGVYHMYVKAHGQPSSMDEILKICRNVTNTRIYNNLNCDPNIILEATRYYVRCLSSMPPFCVETHKDVDISPILEYFIAFYNPATGLPFPIDLIDQEINLPRGMVREFVEEVEARLLRFKDVKSPSISQYFAYIGIQKEE